MIALLNALMPLHAMRGTLIRSLSRQLPTQAPRRSTFTHREQSAHYSICSRLTLNSSDFALNSAEFRPKGGKDRLG